MRLLLLLATVCVGGLNARVPLRPKSTAMKYNGGILGVRAEVHLNRRLSRVSIELRGAPIGGVLSGSATYDEKYNVKLDESFADTLASLRVKILAVNPSHDWECVFVRVKLPFFLGRHTIALQRRPREQCGVCDHSGIAIKRG